MPDQAHHQYRQSKGMSWGKFAAMIATSTIIMFFLMYQLVYSLDHALFSVSRAVASLVMACVMTIVMLGFMWSMYKNKRVNAAITAGSVIVFAASLWLVRSQQTVYDVSYMKAMIPHHSIAIMTSERAHIRDRRVRELADKIIEAQVREIREMKLLIADIERSGERRLEELPPISTEVTPEMEAKAREAVR